MIPGDTTGDHPLIITGPKEADVDDHRDTSGDHPCTIPAPSGDHPGRRTRTRTTTSRSEESIQDSLPQLAIAHPTHNPDFRVRMWSVVSRFRHLQGCASSIRPEAISSPAPGGGHGGRRGARTIRASPRAPPRCPHVRVHGLRGATSASPPRGGPRPQSGAPPLRCSPFCRGPPIGRVGGRADLSALACWVRLGSAQVWKQAQACVGTFVETAWLLSRNLQG